MPVKPNNRYDAKMENNIDNGSNFLFRCFIKVNPNPCFLDLPIDMAISMQVFADNSASIILKKIFSKLAKENSKNRSKNKIDVKPEMPIVVSFNAFIFFSLDLHV